MFSCYCEKMLRQKQLRGRKGLVQQFKGCYGSHHEYKDAGLSQVPYLIQPRIPYLGNGVTHSGRVTAHRSVLHDILDSVALTITVGS